MPRLPHPQPEFRQFRTVNAGAMMPGAAIAQNATVRCIIPVASAQKVRLRFIASIAGSLQVAFLMPGVLAGEYSTFDDALDGTAPTSVAGIETTSVAVSADTEAYIEVECAGEAYLLVEFVEPNTAAGTVTQLAVSQL